MDSLLVARRPNRKFSAENHNVMNPRHSCDPSAALWDLLSGPSFPACLTNLLLLQLARRGFAVMLISRSQDKLDDVARSIGKCVRRTVERSVNRITGRVGVRRPGPDWVALCSRPSDTNHQENHFLM